MRRCWPARDVAERRHSRMKQGDGGAQARVGALGANRTSTARRLRFPCPLWTYFPPFLRHIFCSTSWVWVQGRRTKTGLAAKHLWDGILNFGFILGSLLFGACPCTLPKWRFSGTKSYISFPFGFLGTRHRCDRTVTGPGHVMGLLSGRLQWVRKGFRATSSISLLGCG